MDERSSSPGGRPTNRSLPSIESPLMDRRTSVVFRSRDPEDHFWDPCWRRDGTLIFGRAFSMKAGILQLDPKTGHATPMPGAETLRWPKCSRQGDLLAAAEHPSGFRYVVRRHDRDQWEDLGPIKLAYPQWTRDGGSICGIDIVTGRLDCLSVVSKESSLCWRRRRSPLSRGSGRRGWDLTPTTTRSWSPTAVRPRYTHSTGSSRRLLGDSRRVG